MNNFEDYRKSYDKSALLRKHLDSNPFNQFKSWFTEADESDLVEEANAMTLSVIGLDGFPKSRVVLLKSYNTEGFVFYTNYESEKGKALKANPNVCLSFFWPHAERQIIIKGKAFKISAQESDRYFYSRPKGSQLGAVVSPQSQRIKDRQILEDRLKDLQQEYESKDIKRPENWGGFCVSPISFEFWQGRPNRLHDRFVYELFSKNKWNISRLAP